MQFSASELILNKNGSIYHLNLVPDQICNNIITVGDPERVVEVSKYFEKIHFEVRKREFITTTGEYKGKTITVISTGIGTDNIDIVLNELDALVNINFSNRKLKEKHTSLNIIRIGTSGAIQPNIDIDSTVVTQTAIGMDTLLHYYERKEKNSEDLDTKFGDYLKKNKVRLPYYITNGNEILLNHFNNSEFLQGITLTNSGFYGPQGRVLRGSLKYRNYNKMIENFNYKNLRITNLEMETAGIYGLASILDHKAISLNAILANRITKQFSENPPKTIDQLIRYTLEKMTTL